jgi:hypothetical protein
MFNYVPNVPSAGLAKIDHRRGGSGHAKTTRKSPEEVENQGFTLAA